MIRCLRSVLICTLGLTVLAAVHAATPPTAQAEINYLLEFVESSGCEFYRNGTWYDSRKARTHLQSKYEILAAKDRIKTAEEFIEKAATRSNVSGLNYQVRCSGGKPSASAEWLRGALERYRQGAPREGVVRAPSTSNRPLVILLDREAVMDRLHVFRVSRNGHGLVYRSLASGATAQPYDTILVSIDMNAAHTGDVLGGQLSLNLACNRRILYECHRMRAVGI